MKRPTFEQACSQFPHRFTIDHVPAWARWPKPDGTYPAPQFRSDREWYDSTKFYGETPMATRGHCYTTGETWPLGESLAEPFNSARTTSR